MDDYRSRLINPGSVRVYEMASIDLTPVYTEHRVGHFERRFSISTEIDSEGIIGRISDGVLEIELPDVPH